MLKREFIVNNRQLRHTKQGKPFIALTLTSNDKDKINVEGKIWSENVDKLKNKFKEGDIIQITNGEESVYNNTPQIAINDIKLIKENKWGLNIEEAKDLYYSLLDFLETNIKNEQVKNLTLQTLQKYAKDPFFLQAPAAKKNHHNFPGGLLKHTMELCLIAKSLKETNLYPYVEWDIVYGACILHDMGKIYDYEFKDNMIESTEKISLTGHLVTTPLEIYDTAKTLGIERTPVFENLLHAVIAHHGKKEWGSPQTPNTKEAWVVHLVDMISSQIAKED